MGKCWSFGPRARRLGMCWGLRGGGGIWPGFLPPTSLPSAKASTHADSLPPSAVQGPLCSSTTSLHESTDLPLEEGPQCRAETGAQGRPKACVSIPHWNHCLEHPFPLLACDPLLPSRILRCLLVRAPGLMCYPPCRSPRCLRYIGCSLGPGSRARQSLSPSCLLQQYLSPAETEPTLAAAHPVREKALSEVSLRAR